MREIRISDADRLSHLHKESFTKGWSEQEFLQMLSTGDYFGFICDEGFIIGRKIIDEAEIFAIAVSPNFRHRRIGTELIQNFHERAKKIGIKKIFLEVNINNFVAQKLYSSNGYKTISMRHNYYDNQNAIIMQLTLS